MKNFPENVKHKPHDTNSFDYDKILPTKAPKPSKDEYESSIEEENEETSEEVDHKKEPFYPTIDGRPPKVPQEKPPHKKYSKDDGKGGINNNIFLPAPPHENDFGFKPMGGDHFRPQVVPPQHPGPGYFNPDSTYSQNPQNKPYNVPQNIPPHISIDQLLQHIQGGDNQNPAVLHDFNIPIHGIQPNGINYHQNQQHSQTGLRLLFLLLKHTLTHFISNLLSLHLNFCFSVIQSFVKISILGIPTYPVNGQPDLQVLAINAVDYDKVQVTFLVPAVFVGLHGRIEIKYTNLPNDNDTKNWQRWGFGMPLKWRLLNDSSFPPSSQVFAPPEDLIATPQLEFELGSLVPNSEYKVKITLLLRDLNTQPSSQIYTVKTPPERSITPPSIDIHHNHYNPISMEDILQKLEDPQLQTVDINSTFVTFAWNKISEDEMEFIDALQIRYKELTDTIFKSSPFLHRFALKSL